MDINKEFSVELYFEYIFPKEIVEVILKDFTDSEKIPLSLVSKKFWDVFEGNELHFAAEDFSPFTIPLIEFFNDTKLKNEIHETLCPAAAMNGDIELLKWARSNNYPWNAATSLLAAKYGQLETLKWLRYNECPWDRDVTLYAAKKNHVEILKWALEKGCGMHHKCAMIASERGYFEIVKFLNLFPICRPRMCFGAVRGGHLEILQWILNNGGTWDPSVCKEIVIYGELDILKWLYENKYQFHKKIYKDCIDYGCDEIVEWLEEISYPRK